ncbi:hypothetical protein ABPG75_011804 [Micractinium tetrahymenae]
MQGPEDCEALAAPVASAALSAKKEAMPPQQLPTLQPAKRSQKQQLQQRQRVRQPPLQWPLPSTIASPPRQQPLPPTGEIAAAPPSLLGKQGLHIRDSVADHLFKLLPEWVRHITQDSSRQLLYMERQMTRRLAAVFSLQAQQLQPVLEMRGRKVGEALLDAMVGGKGSNNSSSRGSSGGASSSGSSGDGGQVTYAEVVATSLQDAVGGGLPVEELVLTLDPVLTPFISPFVNGVKAPIYREVQHVKREVEASFAATAAACLLAGFLLGRSLPRRDSSGGGSGGGSSGRT